MKEKLPEDRYTQVKGLNIRYWKIGDSGFPVILIHGLGASAEIWMHNIESLSQYYTVYVPDVVGFGRSEKPPGPFSPSDLTRFIGDFMDELGIEKAHLVGQSLGGGIALQTALQFPDKVDKLALVGSAGLGREVIYSLRLMSLPGIGELLSRPSRIGVKIFFSLAVKNKEVLTEDFLETYYELFRLPGAQRFLLKTVRGIIGMRGGKDDIILPIMTNLHKITQPALILWGKQDQILPVRHADFAHEKLPDSVLHLFDLCGHVVNLERPQEFNRIVLEFLSDSKAP